MELKLKPFGFSTRTPTNCSDNNTFGNLEDYPPINFGPITNDGERGEDTLSRVEYKHETWLSDSPVSRAIERRVFKDTRAQEIEGSTIAKQESKSMPHSWKRKRTARKDGGARHWGNASTGLLQSAAENSRQEIFYPCTFVWGKVADCPWWPAEVVETEVLPPSLQKKTKSEHTPVKFIGIHNSRSNRSFALLKTGNILSFVEHLEKFSQQNISDYEGSCNFEAALAVVKENLDRLNSERPMEKNTRKGHKMSSIWEKSKLKIQQQNDKNARGMRKRRRDVSKGTGKERLSTCSIKLPPVVSVQVTFKRRKAVPEVTEIQTEKESRAKTKNVDKHSSQKRKTIGEDGYFFECVICDIGGNLICCDACPRTYHLDCLEPPLKHTPPGNWQCPTCCGHAEPPKASRRVILERRKIKHHKKEEESALSAVKIPQGRKDSPRTKDSKKMRSEEEETVTSQNLTALNHGLCGLDVRDPVSLEKIESLDMHLEVKFVELQRKQNQQKIEDENEILSYGKEKEVDCILGCRLAKKSPKLASVDNCNDAESHFSILNACKRPVLTDDENCVLKTELQNKAANVTDGNQGGVEVQNLALDIAADRSFKVLRVFQRKRKKSLSQETIQRQESSASENFMANSGLSMEFSNVNMLSSSENVVENLNREPRSAAEFTVGDVKEEQEVGNMDTSGSNILDPQNFEPGMEYLVKWVGRSHIHNDWIGESSLQVLAKQELDNYKLKYGNALCVLVEEKWHKPHRIIARRVSEYGVDEVLVKWCGLGYNECTWESVNEPIVVNNSSLVQEFEHFESIASKVEKSTSKSSTMEAGDIETVTEQPSELKGGSLFPHQMESLNWLRKCWHTRKNAILADGIGLGKAVSCCAFISCLYHEFKVTKPCLILIHLSAMPNWSAEFCAWDPSLNVIEYHGSAQERAMIREHEWYPFKSTKSDKGERACKFNVMLTTYEVIIADASHLQAIPWEIILVDERYWLKNRPSKLFHLLNTFNSTHRILLTDTPLQNNIDEMHSLLNFLQLDTFRSLAIFEDKHNALSTAKHLEELKKVVELHMLCRLKKETIQNIPPITERTIQVDLTSLQSEYYRSLLTRNYQIQRQVDRTEQRQSMIDTVMQLRMVCSHPYIIPGAEPDCGTVELRQETRIKASAKLSLLHLMLKKLKADGHRVLIFSHMTKLLDILQDYLGVEFGSKSYECIDGSKTVADHQAAIARFNRDLLQFVFLLSTRSCGLGINLPTVDTVIIFDSDFNPHDDIQAINRAHRIGQTKRLLVFRLVVRASAEERILQLAKKKSMPDYLFTNEIGCQKEVDDILQWGTEELLQDRPRQTDDTVDISGNDDLDKEELRQMLYEDGKTRKGDGGRGGICEDASLKEGHPTTTWDAAAITCLLDRSESENKTSNGEAENDMCRSLKAWDWNEQDDVSDQNNILKYDESESVIEPKSLVLGEVNEESDCDKILRKRLVKMQIEEEILGQSKRTEKMVLNKENCNIAVQEACNKSMHEDDEAQEPEYVPVGQGLEKKLDRIPARRKECNTSRDNDPEKSWDGEQLNLAARFLPEKVVNQITLPIGSTHQAQSIFPQDSLQGLQTSSYEGIASSHLNKLGFTSERQRVEERKVRGHNLYFPSMVGSTVGLQISSNPLPWTEEELDTLWTGVRRHGRGNWAAMLTDRRLHFSKFRSANDLAERWEKEELKLYGKPPNTCESSEQGRNTSLFGGIHLSKTPNGSMFSFGTSTPPPSKISKENGILPNMKLLLGGPTKLGVSDDFSLFRSRVRVLNDEGRENLANIGPVSHQTRDPRAFLDFPKRSNQTIPNLSDVCSERIQYMPRIRPSPISSSKFPPQTTVLPNGQSSIPSLNENYWKEGTDWGKYATMAFQNRASGNNFMSRFHDKISNREEAGLFQGFGANSKLNKWKAKYSLTDLSPPTVREANADIGVCTGLPHWLKEAFKVEIPPQPSLPPNIVAITQALEVAFKDTKSLLPDWTRPGHAPTPPRKWIQKSKKKKKSIGRDSCKDTQYALASNNDRSVLPGMFIGGKKLKPQISPVMGSTLLDPSFSLKESGSISSSLLNLAALPKGQKGNPNFDPFKPELHPRGKKPNSFWESACLKPQVYNFGGHASSSMRSNWGNTKQFPDVSCELRNPPLAPLFFGFNQAFRGGQNLNSLDSFYTRNSQQAASAGNIYSFNGVSSQSMVYQSMSTKSSVLASANGTVKRNINSKEGSSSKTHSDPCLVLSAKETIHDDDDDDDASSEKTISDDGSSRQ